MSTAKVNTLTGTTSAGSISVTGEGGSTTTNLQQGLAKAWALLDGTSTIALQDSFNMGSVTDHGTGDYGFTVSNPFGSANYTVTANGRQSESPAWTAMTSSVGELDTDDVRITSRNTSNTATDQKQLHTQFIGDLA